MERYVLEQRASHLPRLNSYWARPIQSASLPNRVMVDCLDPSNSPHDQPTRVRYSRAREPGMCRKLSHAPPSTIAGVMGREEGLIHLFEVLENILECG